MTTVFNVCNKISAFKKILKIWLKHTQENNCEMFPSFSDFINSSGLNLRCFIIIIHEHLEALSRMFNDYYPPEDNLRSRNLWITNPFVNHDNINLTDSETGKVAELSSDLGI
jgi:hypothetical protein